MSSGKLNTGDAALYLEWRTGSKVTQETLQYLLREGVGPVNIGGGDAVYYLPEYLDDWHVRHGDAGVARFVELAAMRTPKSDGCLPEKPETMSREYAVKFLNDRGFPIHFGTLANLACRGGGPRTMKRGGYVHYRADWLLEWANGRGRDAFKRGRPKGAVSSPKPKAKPVEKSPPASATRPDNELKSPLSWASSYVPKDKK